MKGQLFLFLFLLLVSVSRLRAQNAPSIEWQRCLGGSGSERANSIQQTTDGGFIVAGNSWSNDGDVSGNHGQGDYWIVKLDSSGNIQWQKSLGGSGDDEAYSIQQTTDGGFVVGGFSYSNDGDVSSHHGNSNSSDYWIVKLDSSGNVQWQKSLGGTKVDLPYSIQQTTDGGFIVAGASHSMNGDVSGNHGVDDYWIVKLDSSGNIKWQKCLGGSSYESAYSIQQATNGGFIIAGLSESNDGDVSGNHGSYDYWIVKLDSSASIQWQESLGGSGDDWAYSTQQTTDGGFIVAGFSESNNGNVTGNHGSGDYWIVKLDSSGNLQWQKSFGGSNGDVASSIQQTADGGFIIAGWSGSNDGDVSSNHGFADYWIVKMDSSGNLQWQKSFGGSNGDEANSIQQTTDGGFIVAGWSGSNDGDVTGNHGNVDYWIVKLAADIPLGSSFVTSSEIVSVYPNPAQSQLIINLATPAEENSIQVFDLYGRMISLPVSLYDDEAELNIETLTDGLYNIQITDKRSGKIEVGKFVKSN